MPDQPPPCPHGRPDNVRCSICTGDTTPELDAVEVATPHPETPTSRVVNELAAERRRQIAKGWTPAHDDQHETPELVDLALDRVYLFDHSDVRPLRRRIIESAAMLVAAVEAMDRQEARR